MTPLLARVDGRARIAILLLIAVAVLVPVLALATPLRSPPMCGEHTYR